MNKKLGLILLYVAIVGASVYIVVRWYLYLKHSGDQSLLHYIVLGFFILFTFLNLRKLLVLIKNYKKHD